MKLYIGSCVIAMNKNFTSDMYIRQVDKKKMENVLKYYQSTVFIPEFTDEFNQCSRNAGLCNEIFYYDLPESIIEEYGFEELDELENKIVTCMVENIRNRYENCILPIITIFNSKNLIPGHYAIDINNKKVLCYKSINEEQFTKLRIDNDFRLSISYFIDVCRSTFYKGEYGFIENVMFIGALDNLLSKELEGMQSEKIKLRVPQQFYTHEIGLNLKQQLLILTEFFK